MPGVDLRFPSPLVELYDEFLNRHHVRLYLKRDDLINPEMPGNKWRKLKYNVAAATAQHNKTLLTFGGAYSNHIRATAAAGYYFGFDTVGVIRGEEHLPLNESLAFAVGRGMKLHYIDRTAYRKKDDPELIAELREKFGEFYLLPEGGSNALAVRGCAELVDEIDIDFDLICCPVGTGGTLAGIATRLEGSRRALGFSALKGGQFLDGEVAELQRAALGRVTDNWSIDQRFHFGGFARRNSELDAFIERFYDRHQIELDWVYVAKMMKGIYAMVEGGEIPAKTVIVALITG